MGVSLLNCPGSTANWWMRSVNSSNSNNFRNVNTNGNSNNNNANNANGVAPDFTKPLVGIGRLK